MSIKLKAGGNGSVSLDVPAGLTADHTLTLPNGVGSANQVLKNGATAGELEYGQSLPSTNGNPHQVLKNSATAGELEYGLTLPSGNGSAGQFLRNTSTPGVLEFADVSTSPTAGQIIEQIEGICDGRQVTVGSGTYTLPTATYGQLINTTTYADLTGSDFSYTPPNGTNTVVYDLLWHTAYVATYAPLLHAKMFFDGTEVTIARTSYYVYYDTKAQMRIAFSLNNATQDIANAKIGTWNTAKNIKIQMRAYTSNYSGIMHKTYYFDGGASGQNSAPTLRITAIA